MLRYNTKLKTNLKKIIVFIIIFSVLGVGVMFIIDSIVNATKFMYIPEYYNNGDNAYNRGWESTTTEQPSLSFVYYGDCGCSRALKLVTTDENKGYGISFSFDYSYFVRTKFSVILEGEDMSNVVIRALVLQYNQPIVTVPITEFDVNREYYIELNNTRLEIGMNNVKTYEQPISSGGMDGLKFEITGFKGIVYFVDLKGRRL